MPSRQRTDPSGESGVKVPAKLFDACSARGPDAVPDSLAVNDAEFLAGSGTKQTVCPLSCSKHKYRDSDVIGSHAKDPDGNGALRKEVAAY